MRFTTRECLEKMQLAMQNGIAPGLPATNNNMVALGVVMQGLDELLKRELATTEFLKQLIPEGLALSAQQIDLLEAFKDAEVASLRAEQQRLQNFVPAWDHVAGLQSKYNDLVSHVERCA